MRALSLLLALTAIASPTTALAEDSPTLPLFITEEAAADSLEKRISEQTMVTIDKVSPLAPEKIKGFVGVGVNVTASGTQPNITTFITHLSAAPFCKLPSVAVNTDRRDPTIIRASLTVKDWYATKEKAATKTKRWQRTTQPSQPALELWLACESHLPAEGVKITNFSASDDSIQLIGESHNANIGRSYGAKIFSDEKLSSHTWTWLQRPTQDARKKDGSATFRIQGQPKKANKRQQRIPTSSASS